jgi:hypothetical protein
MSEWGFPARSRFPGALVHTLSLENAIRHPAIAVAIPQKYRSDELRLMWKFLPSRETRKAKQIAEKPRS